jgi:hypothetical protein
MSASAALDCSVRSAFERYDRDGSGTLEVSELRQALEAAGLEVDEAQCGYMLRKYDDDRSACLDLEEFTALVADLRSSQVQSVQARLNLRTHSLVLEALDAWWSAAVASMQNPSALSWV